jgi:hypothetical protein
MPSQSIQTDTATLQMQVLCAISRLCEWARNAKFSFNKNIQISVLTVCCFRKTELRKSLNIQMNVCLLFLQEKSGTHAQHLTHKALKT